MSVVGVDTAAELERLRLADVAEDCWEHPWHLLNEIKVVDQRTGERFSFTGMDDPLDGWAWQRETLDWWMAEKRTLILKARQLGVTYLAAGLALWYLLYKPGSRVLVYSIGEDEAKLVARRIWLMYQSLPPVLKEHARVLKPKRTELVSDEIILSHDQTTQSSLRALSSTKAAGHSEVAQLAILDEFAYNDNALAVLKATLPATSGGGKKTGKVLIVSTANGVGGELDGANVFYALYSNAEARRIDTRFLGVFTHPERDEDWYDEHALALPARERYESYPRTPEEAFQGTGACWFDDDAMAWYRDRLPEPLERFRFDDQKGVATIRKADDGIVRLYVRPEESHHYAIAVDPAGGSGRDSSVVYVLDLSTCELCAEIRSATIDPDRLAAQIHYLGRWYGTQSGCDADARVCVERTGGWGAVIITALRDGREHRPPYTRLYRHRDTVRPDLLEEPRYGFPTTRQTRPQIISALEQAIRERWLPALTPDLYRECSTFGEHVGKSGKPLSPSPSAAPGTNDDTVMAAAIAMYVYGLYGEAPKRIKAVARNKRFYYRRRLSPKPFQPPRRRAA